MMAYSLDLRIKIIEMYDADDGIEQREFAESFGISHSTFKRWLKRKREGEPLIAKTEGKGRPEKIDEKGLSTIQNLIEKKPTITLRELSEAYYKKHDIKVNHSIVFRALKKLNISYKKISKRASEKNTAEVKKKKRFYK